MLTLVCREELANVTYKTQRKGNKVYNASASAFMISNQATKLLRFSTLCMRSGLSLGMSDIEALFNKLIMLGITVPVDFRC